jgi:hypothetical protein
MEVLRISITSLVLGGSSTFTTANLVAQARSVLCPYLRSLLDAFSSLSDPLHKLGPTITSTTNYRGDQSTFSQLTHSLPTLWRRTTWLSV